MSLTIIETTPNSKSLSRYNYCDYIQDEDGFLRLESQPPIEIQKSSDDTLYTVKSGEEGRLDLISYKFYGTPFLWWLIAYASNIVDPISVSVGTVLRIPPKSKAEVIKR